MSENKKNRSKHLTKTGVKNTCHIVTIYGEKMYIKKVSAHPQHCQKTGNRRPQGKKDCAQKRERLSREPKRSVG